MLSWIVNSLDVSEGLPVIPQPGKCISTRLSVAKASPACACLRTATIVFHDTSRDAYRIIIIIIIPHVLSWISSLSPTICAIPRTKAGPSHCTCPPNSLAFFIQFVLMADLQPLSHAAQVGRSEADRSCCRRLEYHTSLARPVDGLAVRRPLHPPAGTPCNISGAISLATRVFFSCCMFRDSLMLSSMAVAPQL